MRQTTTLMPILTTIFTTMVIFTRVGIADTFPLPSEEFAPQTQEVSDRFGLYSSEERPATVGWNYSGALRFLHAPQGISLGMDGTLEESVELFFESNEDLLGIDVNQLVLASSHELVGAGDLLVFQQTLEGVPVYGGFVKVMIGLDRHVISVNSRYVSGLVLCDGCQSVLSANADNDNALLFVNFTEESLLALPATRETVEEDSILYERLTSLVDGQTLAKTQITEFLDEGTRTIKSHAYHNKTYSTTCANDAGCDVADCTPNCKCELEYFDFLGNTSRCVKGCGSCPPSYSCAGTTGAFRHFCKNTSASINNTVTIMDHGTWQSPYEQYLRHVKLGAVATWLQNIIDFHYLGLKRDGWLNMAGTVEYKVDVLAGTTDWGDVSGSSSIGSDYIILAEDIWKDISIDPIRIMSHEFGHLISTLDANGSVGHDYCLSESHANMMASLAVRYWS